MSSCLHCRNRKGKRECPALRGKICAACCGEYRLVEIACPSDCIYLQANEEYQHRRVLDRVPPAWLERIWKYEDRGGPSLELLHEIQFATCLYALERQALDLTGAWEGLQFARRRMSLIETPEPYVPPFGEFLVERLDRLITARALVEREEIREVLDETLGHLEAEVPAEVFPEFLRFLRGIYAEHLADEMQGRPSGRSPLILPR